ncbi:MAG: hypothetical protein JW880_04380 [Candidatus Thermoplasmatota archaeon]|nr:hypothetical protein [Candidatus Thermoplasmatota archaeon]
MSNRREDPIDWGFKNYLQNRFSTVPKNDLEKILDNILGLIELSRDKKRDVKSILEQAARTIFRLFDFQEIAIGLKNPKDGLYRYEVLLGYSRNTEMAFRKLQYTSEEMVSYDRYPFVKIGRISELDPVEGISENEKHLYDRPLALGYPRASPEDFMEGDYIDVWMYDGGGDLIGWLELSKPRNGKMPSSDTVRWIEVIADVCALIVDRKR